MDNKKSELKKAIIMILFVFVVMNCATASGANVKNVKKYTKQIYYKNDNNEYYKSSLMVDTYHYDRNGKLIMILHESNDLDSIETECFDYDRSNGNIIGSRSCYTSYYVNSKGNTGETARLAIYERMHNDHMDVVYEKSTFLYYEGEDPSAEIIYAYEYDDHNNIITKSEWITQYGESFYRTTDYDYEYYKDGRIKSMKSSDGYTYTYIYEGYRIIQIVSIRESPDNELKIVEKFEYR